MDAVTATSTATSAASNTASSRSTITSDFDTFLQLLTAQLENQDPLNPLESTEFATQIATFSGVEQQVLTNELLEGLTTSLGATEIGQLAGWVGLDVRAAMPVYFDGSPITLAPSPPAGTDEMALLVRDASGSVVQRLSLPVSSEQVEWAGVTDSGNPLPPGTYSFVLESSTQGAVTATSDVEVYARVQEARTENGELFLTFEGGTLVDLNKVTAVRGNEAGTTL